MKGDFPFTILDVINALGLSVRRISGDRVYFDCPVCPSFSKSGKPRSGQGKVEARITESVFNCPACGDFHGGMLDLFCYYRNCDKAEANRHMRQYVSAQGYDKNQSLRIVQKARKIKEQNVSLASNGAIDKTYRRFLSLCTLSNEHISSLNQRGLSKKQILRFGLCSAPVLPDEHRYIIHTLLSEGYVLNGVPGFFRQNGKWDYALWDRYRGILIPMVSPDSQLLGFQIRFDNPIIDKNNPKKRIKYLWFSSKDMPEGTSRTSVGHITNAKEIPECVYLTEGGLKADIASIYGNRVFAAIAGVTQFPAIETLLNQLKARGVKKIVDAFDADYVDNENVEKCRKRLKEITQKKGLEYFRLEWDKNKGKGIDDYLVSVPRGKREFRVTD